MWISIGILLEADLINLYRDSKESFLVRYYIIFIKEKIEDDWNTRITDSNYDITDVEEEEKKEISINFSYPTASSLHWEWKLFDSQFLSSYFRIIPASAPKDAQDC